VIASPDLVPPEILVPPDAHSRRLDRHESALVLDGWLRRLARQEARGRLVLGRLARAFLRRRGHHVLGFARLDDWARERLGLSGREIQSMATVADRLRTLPALAGAFAAGELSWAQLRLLARVATPETQAHWLGLARGHTVRALEAHVRAARGPLAADPDGDAEPRATFRLRCPARVARLWRDTVELARRMAGAQLGQGDAAEAIAAEGLAAGVPPGCGQWPAPPDAEHPRADADEDRTTFAEALDWDAVREALPAQVEALADDADALDPFTLDARLRAAVRALQRIDWQTGRLLRVLFDRRLHQLMGFRSAARYARERLGISARKAGALVALERRSWQAPGLGEAWRDGTLSWTRALALLPVAGEYTVQAWLARAGEVTVRRLADEVEWALTTADGRSPMPPPLGGTLVVDERHLCARSGWEAADAEVRFTAPAAVAGLLCTAVLAFRPPGEPLWRGLEHLLRHVRAEWTAQPRHRDPVFARDGWRCAVPVCTARRELHDHHVLFRSRGGDNRRTNRVTLCAWHHLRGIHGGRVRVWGDAPDGLTWEIGVRHSRPPLLRVAGAAAYDSPPAPSTLHIPGPRAAAPPARPGWRPGRSPSGRAPASRRLP
jgi:hypothetical protein